MPLLSLVVFAEKLSASVVSTLSVRAPVLVIAPLEIVPTVILVFSFNNF